MPSYSGDITLTAWETLVQAIGQAGLMVYCSLYCTWGIVHYSVH